MKLRSVTILLVIFASAQAMALDPEACNAAVKMINDRLASGNHPQQNAAIAMQVRDGITQSCPFLDETTLAGMMQGLNQLLPGGNGTTAAPQKSNAERDAERQAQRAEAAERRAERDKQRAADRAQKEAEQGLVSNVARKPPTARSVKGQLMSRTDEMWGTSVVDWDVFDNKARLLYSTWPSREQGKLPNAARHFYVVEWDSTDNIVQHYLLETGRARTVTAGLIRGRDEVVLQWHERNADGGKPSESILERWSISTAEMLSRATAPEMTGPRGPLGADQHFNLVTVRGDLLFAITVPLESGPMPKTGLVWMLASPDGEVRDQGLIVHENEKISASDWFHSANGGAGLVLDVTGVGDDGINSRLKPDNIQFGSTNVRPVIASERRLYVVGGAETGASLPAFGRQLMWMGLENLDQSIMISGESTRVVNEAEGKYRVRDSTVSSAAAGRYRMALAPTSAGHAILIKNNHRDDEFPPKHGLWLQEFGDGQPRRDTYLNPDAEHLGSQFNMLASDGEGNLYVASNEYVLRLTNAREIAAYAKSSAPIGGVKAMVARGNNVWLFGEHRGTAASQQQVWAERVQF